MRGARLVQGGASFGVHSERAEGVELCLFDGAGNERRSEMRRGEDDVWTTFVGGVGAGQRYGFRVHGPYAPSEGDRFNPAKLVVDPRARAFAGKVDHWGPLVGGSAQALDPRDSAAFVPKSVVVDESFDWGNDAPPRVPWDEVVLYEAHVKGLTRRHPDVDEARRGTYAALGAPPIVAHLKSIGVTTLELLPINEALDEAAVALRGRTNYWGYSTLGYFAADQRFASEKRDPVRELKTAVKALHAAGIEVILDVVYNHTCEIDERGPTVSFRGLDNRAYYRLDPADRAKYVDYTGCGNTLDASRPEVIRLVLDSLRYWVNDVHVDGFRFDLAPALGRGRDGVFDPEAPLLTALLQDPVLSRVKLIAEPWDVGPMGFQLGRFPTPFREWNAFYRDGVRRFWNGHTRSLADMGYRLTGSSDTFSSKRGPTASVTFVTAHDGFTMRDLVSYERKHNEPNGEKNQDGLSANLSTNFGVEGETPDAAIVALREKQVRNLLGTLLLTPGVPMLVAGDELWRTQRGNNNAYVLDDATSWIDWTDSREAREVLAFVRGVIKLRAERPELRRSEFFNGRELGSLPPASPDATPASRPPGPRPTRRDIVWLRPDGADMIAADWGEPTSPTTGTSTEPATTPLAMAVWMPGARGHVLLLNASSEPVTFRLPRSNVPWSVLVDTRAAKVPYGGEVPGGELYEAAPRSLILVGTP